MRRKSTLKKRLVAAFNAFKNYGHPVFIPLPPPPYEVRHPNLCTVLGRATYFHSYYMERERKAAELEAARRRVALEISLELLRSGCITFTEDAKEMALIGVVRALSPEEEAKT